MLQTVFFVAPCVSHRPTYSLRRRYACAHITTISAPCGIAVHSSIAAIAIGLFETTMLSVVHLLKIKCVRYFQARGEVTFDRQVYRTNGLINISVYMGHFRKENFISLESN